MSETRTLKVDYLARVEGEGALTLTYRDDGTVDDVALRIFEPPRFFEAFLRGRSCLETPDLTARICGICPVAYQTSACEAVEDALGVVLPEPLRQLRRALYCGEWIESHVLHMAMLHTPDFLGVDDAIAVAKSHRDKVATALQAKKVGNTLVSTLGGREIHPVNVKVGGFYRLPRREERDDLVGRLRGALPLVEELVRWMAGFDFPALDRDYTFVALQPGHTYPFVEGPIGTSTGLRIPASEWGAHFAEEHVQRTNALHARFHGEPYLTGPLARFALNFDALPEHLKRLAGEVGLQPPVRNPFRSLLVRGIEVLYALEEAGRILSDWTPPPEPAVEVPLRAAVGHGVSEAPRGLLYHRYDIDEQGLVLDAQIVPPTSQNQLSIEGDLRALAPSLLPLDHEAASRRAEHAIRNHDPCISCATHFLTLERVVR